MQLLAAEQEGVALAIPMLPPMLRMRLNMLVALPIPSLGWGPWWRWSADERHGKRAP